MIQEKILKFILIFYYILLKFLGLFPYKYNEEKNTFHITWIQLLHSILTLFCISILYLISINTIIKNMQKNVYSDRIQIIGSVFLQFILCSLLSIYLIQYFNLRKLKKLLHNVIIFTVKISKLYCVYDDKFKNELFMLIVQSLVIPLIHLNLSATITNNSVYCLKKKSTILFFLIPYGILTILPNCFYGIMLGIRFYLKLISKQMLKIMKTASIIIAKNNIDINDYQYRQMKIFCELSDALDECHNFYMDMAKLINEFCCVFSMQTLLWSFYGFVSFIIQLFAQYVYIIEILRGGEVNYDKSVHWFNVIHIVLEAFPMYLMSHVCACIIDETNKMSKILYSSEMLMVNVDIRFRKSVIINERHIYETKTI